MNVTQFPISIFFFVVVVSFYSSSANRIISLKEYDEMKKRKIETTQNATFKVMQELKIEEQCDFSNETISISLNEI